MAGASIAMRDLTMPDGEITALAARAGAGGAGSLGDSGTPA
ncbi:MAG: hypothetical protein ACREM3_09680 [Candidatus Rokuibacteriota bacterium]